MGCKPTICHFCSIENPKTDTKFCWKCNSCHQNFCKKHCTVCEKCKITIFCLNDSVKCSANCENRCCKSHKNDYLTKCTKCELLFCKTHLFKCTLCDTKNLCEKEIRECEFCPSYLKYCIKHLVAKYNNNRKNLYYVCSNHLNEKMNKREIKKENYVTFHYDHANEKLVQLFDLNRKIKWNIIFDIKVPYNEATIIIENQFYIIGGHTLDKNISNTYRVNIVNLKGANNARFYRNAIQLSDLNLARCHMSLVNYDNKYIFALGGAIQTRSWNYQASAICERYDIKQNKWFLVKPLNEAKYGIIGCYMNSNIYSICGYLTEGNKFSNQIERLNLLDNESDWEICSLKNESPIQEFQYQATEIGNNKMLIFGGFVAPNEIPKCCILTHDKITDKYEISMTKSQFPLEKGFWREYKNCVYDGKKVYGICTNYKIPLFNTFTQKWILINNF